MAVTDEIIGISQLFIITEGQSTSDTIKDTCQPEYGNPIRDSVQLSDVSNGLLEQVALQSVINRQNQFIGGC